MHNISKDNDKASHTAIQPVRAARQSTCVRATTYMCVIPVQLEAKDGDDRRSSEADGVDAAKVAASVGTVRVRLKLPFLCYSCWQSALLLLYVACILKGS